MTGPVRDDMPERPDPWDEPDIEVPTDVEDIAIVCHEALRAFRTTQGGGSGFPWMHRTTAERKEMIEAVQRHIDRPDDVLPDDAEGVLVSAIVKALKP